MIDITAALYSDTASNIDSKWDRTLKNLEIPGSMLRIAPE
jgi:hypothetical protein